VNRRELFLGLGAAAIAGPVLASVPPVAEPLIPAGFKAWGQGALEVAKSYRVGDLVAFRMTGADGSVWKCIGRVAELDGSGDAFMIEVRPPSECQLAH
jgi:hypothetical protein